MPVSKQCQHCGQSFLVPPRRSDEVKFCSRECKTAAGWVTLKCECCGESFKKKASSNADSKRFFCSRACYYKVQKGRTNADKGRPKYFKKCEVCAKEFRVTLTRVTTAKYCSRKCLSESPEFKKQCSESQLREKSSRWTGGTYYSSAGYIRTHDEEFGRMGEHRRVVLKAMLKEAPGHPFLVKSTAGKWMLRGDIEVHHIDRVRSNNELGNLLAVTIEAHARIHNHNTKPKPDECWPTDPKTW